MDSGGIGGGGFGTLPPPGGAEPPVVEGYARGATQPISIQLSDRPGGSAGLEREIMRSELLGGRRGRGLPVRPVVGGIAAACAVLAAPARAQVDDFAAFGANGANIGQAAKIFGGLTGSNGNVAYVAGNTFSGLVGGGSLTYTSTGGSVVLDGPVTFTGDVNLGVAPTGRFPINAGGAVNVSGLGTLAGGITAGGPVLFSGSTVVNGDVRSNSNVTQDFSFGVINGNVAANGNVVVNGTVNGNVRHGGGYTRGTFGVVTGAVTAGTSAVSPVAYVPRTLPAATSFSSGGADVRSASVFEDTYTIAPGSYGRLEVSTFDDVVLSPGDYFFDSVSFDGSNDLRLTGLTRDNRIRIFVTGDVELDTFVRTTVNGVPLIAADRNLVDNVLLETRGNYTEVGLGNVEFFGTIFTPTGDLTGGQYSTYVGSLIAGDVLTVGTSALVNPVPEPAAASTLALAALALLRRRSRHSGRGV